MTNETSKHTINCPYCDEQISANSNKCLHCSELIGSNHEMTARAKPGRKINTVERVYYSGGLYGLIAGSSKGKLQGKIDKMNEDGWNLHFIHPESQNIIRLIFKIIILIFTLTIWTLGSSELLIFEKEER